MVSEFESASVQLSTSSNQGIILCPAYTDISKAQFPKDFVVS